MKKRPYTKKIVALVVVVGAFHVVLFGMNPSLPPKPETHVISAEPLAVQSSSSPQYLADASVCRGTPVADETDAVIAAPTSPVEFTLRPVADLFRNTGKAVQIEMARGSSIRIDNRNYPLRTIRFRAADAQGHRAFDLIHRDRKHLVVVTIPLQVGNQANPSIEALWRYLPKLKGDHNALDDIHLDVDNLFPGERHFYRLSQGESCGSNVLLLGFDKPVTISAKQALKLDKVLRGSTMASAF